MSGTIQLQLDDLSGIVDIKTQDSLKQSKIQKLLTLLLKNKPKEGSSEELFYESTLDLLSQMVSEKTLCEVLTLKPYESLRPKYRQITTYDNIYLRNFASNLDITSDFDAHVSIKLKGLNVDLIYEYGELKQCIIPYFYSTPVDITEQVIRVAENQNVLVIDAWNDIDKVTIQSKIVLPEKDYYKYLYDLKLDANFFDLNNIVLQILNAQDEKYIDNLHIVSFGFLCEGFEFQTKTELYDYLSENGFELPMSWTIPELNKDTIALDISNILADCAEEVIPDEDGNGGYPYINEGVILSIDDLYMKSTVQKEGRYSNLDLCLKLNHWKLDIITGYVQTILWEQTCDELRPFAIMADDSEKCIINKKNYNGNYIFNIYDISNINAMGVKYKDKTYVKLPLCNPYLILLLDAYPNFSLNFTLNKYLGMIPCYEEQPLMQQAIQSLIS